MKTLRRLFLEDTKSPSVLLRSLVLLVLPWLLALFSLWVSCELVMGSLFMGIRYTTNNHCNQYVTFLGRKGTNTIAWVVQLFITSGYYFFSIRHYMSRLNKRTDTKFIEWVNEHNRLICFFLLGKLYLCLSRF